MLGLIIWGLIFIIIAICITPWWFFPLVFTVLVIFQILENLKW